MKIERIEIYRVDQPLVYPFRTAFGNNESIESVLVKLSADGVHGWGEGAPWQDPAYCSEWASGQFLVTRDRLGPRLVGQDISSGEQLHERLSIFKGNEFAKAHSTTLGGISTHGVAASHFGRRSVAPGRQLMSVQTSA